MLVGGRGSKKRIVWSLFLPAAAEKALAADGANVAIRLGATGTGQYYLAVAGGYSFIKLDRGATENAGLRELASSSGSSSVRKEFDPEIIGIFDKYAEDFKAFRIRIVPSEIKQRSPVKSGRRLAAG